MSREKNTEIAKALLEGMGTGRDPSEIAALFAEDLVFEIQGDAGVLPWTAAGPDATQWPTSSATSAP